MNRKPAHTPLKTWQFYSACIYHLGKSFLTQLYQRSERQIERWSADPDTTESHQRNPIDRYEVLLTRLMERGLVEIARACVRRQTRLVDCELMRREDVPVPDKKSIAEECLDDLPALAEFHRVLRDPHADVQEVITAKAAIARELSENYVRWCAEKGVKP